MKASGPASCPEADCDAAPTAAPLAKAAPCFRNSLLSVFFELIDFSRCPLNYDFNQTLNNNDPKYTTGRNKQKDLVLSDFDSNSPNFAACRLRSNPPV